MQPLLPEDFLAPAAEAPGWYGKIPALGDFATRRLPPAFTERWDAWLARGIEASKLTLGAAWLETYLGGPLWRFALSPGLIDERYWFGVLMPSVDRVGRYYPLTIAQASSLPPSPPLAPLAQWYERVAQAALACLGPAATVESFESTLAAIEPLAFLAVAAPPAASDGAIARLPATNGLGDAFAHAAARLLLREYRGASYWSARLEEQAAPAVIVYRGLPEAAAFARLLDGSL